MLDADASDWALGTVIQQKQDVRLKVIVYASRALSDAERRYCITRREMLSVVWGLKKFRQHLLVKPILVQTDHAALTYLMRTREQIGQQGRWLDLLGDFDVTIQHRPGRVHGNSDTLSRRPCERDGSVECRQCANMNLPDRKPVRKPDRQPVREPVRLQEPDRQFEPVRDPAADVQLPCASRADAAAAMQSDGDVTRLQTAEITASSGGDGHSISMAEIQKAQAADDSISAEIKCCNEGAPPTGTDLRELPDEARVLIAQWESLLYRLFHHPDGSTRYLQVVLPGSLRRRYAEELHAELGHFGQYKTGLAIVQRAYFPGWRSLTKWVVRNRVQAVAAGQTGS